MRLVIHKILPLKSVGIIALKSSALEEERATDSNNIKMGLAQMVPRTCSSVPDEGAQSLPIFHASRKIVEV